MLAPFPWFGGKRKVAAEVWGAFGDVDNYVEPFGGSLAVLLGRPSEHVPRSEIVNDADGYICNFWRALQASPNEVARYADAPANENELIARHVWLVNEGRERLQRLEGDPDYYDAKVAGWWVWGICCWIGPDWCSGRGGPWHSHNGRIVDARTLGARDSNQPTATPDLGRGVTRKLLLLHNNGVGIFRGRNSGGQGGDIYSYFRSLATRLRRVRVCSGNWSRVVTRAATYHGSKVGVFLDPPYSDSVCASGLYRVDSAGISKEVREWAISRGNDRRLRICLAGYEDEHAAHMPENWRVLAWSANRAYGSKADDTANAANRHKERLWFSPGCLGIGNEGRGPE